MRDKPAAAHGHRPATVRADGRPHVVPVDGVWVDDRLYFGGRPEASGLEGRWPVVTSGPGRPGDSAPGFGW
ncbi:pyridoxamine 5'-phosphate oxidase family protein [Nonomuraea sp. NPDC050643]|uniref:pyridoxamine 5'-phosphate oxidase family protein n=1 Tax=Nonomuraea sp. NPDC050643 TaxID=3155660 RepID=UPI0033D3A10F